MSPYERNIIINTPALEAGDQEFMFHDEPVEIFPPETTWADLLAETFGSRGQVRRMGYHEIPWGWTDIRIGKMKIRYCIYKPQYPTSHYEEEA